MTNRTNSEFTSHCRIVAKTNILLLFSARFAHACYSSRMIDRFLNWGDHGKPKSGKIKGRGIFSPAPLFPCMTISCIFSNFASLFFFFFFFTLKMPAKKVLTCVRLADSSRRYWPYLSRISYRSK